MQHPDKMESGFSMTAQEGIQSYAENITKLYELMDRVIQSVREGNEYQAVEMIRARNRVRRVRRLSDELTEWKYDFIELRTLLMHELRSSGMSELLLDTAQAEFVQRIEQARTVEECQKLSEEMIRHFCQMQEHREIHSYPMLIQKIILAVDKDLTQTLTLQYFAEELNVNDSYLSNLFRREVGMTITDYVTGRRIAHAADLLLTTQYPIKTVAKQVGITDVHYFSRIFKKRMGKSPTCYREDRG
jgi:YesN/AraC family two-component response regulator